MYIKRLYLKNFRGFVEQDFIFHDKLTLVIGKNASGKSSLLEGLCVALGGWICGFDGLESSDKRNILKADRRTITSRVNSALLEQIPVEVECDASFRNGENVIWSRSITSHDGRTTTGGLKQLREITAPMNKKIHSADDEEIVLPIIAYYSAARLWNEPIHRETRAKRDNNRLDGYKKAVSFSNSIKDAMQFIDRLAHISNSKTNSVAAVKLIAILEALKISLQSVLQDVDIYYDMEIAELCVVNHRGEYIPFSLLSDGYRCAASLIIDICRRIMTLNPHLGGAAIQETNGIVLVDEIDLHLHPRWQQIVLNDLQRIFPRIQFIVTTHAASVIQSVRDVTIMLLSNEGVSYFSHGVYGMDVNTVLRGVQDAIVRPEAIENHFAEIYKHIDEGELTLANQQTQELEQIIGTNDPEISGIKVSLDIASLED